MHRKTTWVSLGIFLAVLVAGAYFLTKDNMATKQQLTPEPTPTPVEEGKETELPENETAITIKGTEFIFTPSMIEAKPGKIEITFINTGMMQHNLVFEDLDLETGLLGKGEEETLEFELTKPGIYTFYCAVGNHRQLGMEGELIVE
jgi:plastocyanin